jgi:hypothetical protein
LCHARKGWQAGRVSTDPAGDPAGAPEPELETLVIGAQLAAARAAQARHEATPRVPSPLAAVSYDQPREELSLLHFTVVPTDEIIDEFVTGFAASGDADKDALRASLTMDDFYTLLDYARRAAVRAIRSDDEAVARRGVTALAAIDLDRVDWRDAEWQAGLLSYALGRIGASAAGDGVAARGKAGNGVATGEAASGSATGARRAPTASEAAASRVAGAFTEAAALASGETATFLASVAGRPPARLSDWGFREIQTAEGIGLVEDDGEPDRAKADLVGLAKAVAAGLAGDIWQLSEPATGSRIPAVWLRGGQPEELDHALGSITGCVKLRGALASQDSPDDQAQHMLVFLAQTRDPQAASVIAAAAGPGADSDSFFFAALGVVAGTLCAVMIARSFVHEVPALETQASLERFRQVLARTIERS